MAGDGDGKGWLDRTTRNRDTLPGHQPRSLQETHALDLAQFALYFAAALLLAPTPPASTWTMPPMPVPMLEATPSARPPASVRAAT